MDKDIFIFANEEKHHRAIYGTVGNKGQSTGGVGEDADNATVLAEYDRLGGLILLNGEKVKTGSFYDFAARKPRSKPTVVVLYQVGNKTVEVPQGEALPLAVQAAKLLAQEEAEKPKGKKGRGRKVEEGETLE